jgi:hypothetical protein
MNPEIKAEWGEWLLANANRQGGGALRHAGAATDGSNDTFCCLGGLCERGVLAGIVRRELIPGSNIYQYVSVTDATDADSEVLPQAIVEWAQLPSPNPRIWMSSSRPEYTTLATLNDQATPFPAIWKKISAAF